MCLAKTKADLVNGQRSGNYCQTEDTTRAEADLVYYESLLHHHLVPLVHLDHPGLHVLVIAVQLVVNSKMNIINSK